MPLKQPDENPSAESASQSKRCQQQRRHARSVICQKSALPKNQCPEGQADGRAGCRSDRRDAIFFDRCPTFGRSVDCGGAAEPGPMEVLQYGPTCPRALENADHKNAIAI